MVTLRSPRYPGLLLADLGERFVDGVLETGDPVVVARARRLSHMGVTVEGTLETPVRGERKDQPRGNASRAAWAQYATGLGIAVDEAMTRNEIRALVGGAHG